MTLVSKNKFDKISVKTSSSQGGFGGVNPGLVSNTEYILIYAKDRAKARFNENFLFTDKNTSQNVKFCDIRDLKHTTKIITEYQPDIILNFAALVDLEYCEQEKDDCYLTNTIAAIHLFNLAKDKNIPYVFISTAGIFGNDKEFYTEADQPYPLSAYGKSKYYVEQLLQNQTHLVYHNAVLQQVCKYLAQHTYDIHVIHLIDDQSLDIVYVLQ